MHDDKGIRRRRWLGPASFLLTGSVLVVTSGVSGCGGDDTVGPGADAGRDSPAHETGTPDVGNPETGNPDTGTNPDGGGPKGNGTIGTAGIAANDNAVFVSPFDATPSPDGQLVYFTAIAADGSAGVFKANAAGGAVTKLTSGGPLVSPFGIAVSADGAQLFIADPGAETGTDLGGQVFSMPSAGGTPTVVAGLNGFVARGLELVGTNLYFTGTNPANGTAGVYQVASTGGTPTLLASGAPLFDPSGIAVTAAGDVFVLDTVSSASRKALVIRIPVGGAAAVFGKEMLVGYPAGIALAQDESAVIVSALDSAKSTDVVYRIAIADQSSTPFTTGIGQYSESAGLHRAKNGDTYAWADGTANGGTVFVLSK